jgi:hypothetical protein
MLKYKYKYLMEIMKKNLGQVDRVARIFVGAVILIVAAQFQSWWGLIGLALLVTGLVGYCGLYDLLKIKTCCKTDAPGQPTTPATSVKQQPPVTPQK